MDNLPYKCIICNNFKCRPCLWASIKFTQTFDAFRRFPHPGDTDWYVLSLFFTFAEFINQILSVYSRGVANCPRQLTHSLTHKSCGAVRPGGKLGNFGCRKVAQMGRGNLGSASNTHTYTETHWKIKKIKKSLCFASLARSFWKWGWGSFITGDQSNSSHRGNQ